MPTGLWWGSAQVRRWAVTPRGTRVGMMTLKGPHPTPILRDLGNGVDCAGST